MNNRFLKLCQYPNFLWLYKDYLPELRSQLVFQNHLQNSVDQWKASMSSKSSKKIVFVGVHCRRTDYANHLNAVVANGTTLVDQNYFDRAFQIYRERYNSEERQVRFLAVSDDNEWIKVTTAFT